MVFELQFEHFDIAPPSGGTPPAIAQNTKRCWAFMARDGRSGCQVASDQIIVHTRSYEKFTDFATLVRLVVGTVEKHSRSFDVTALGIRYLDRLSPQGPDEELKDYLKAGFLAQAVEQADLELIGGLSHRLYRTPDGVLQARFWSGQGYTVVPDDIMPLFMLTEAHKQPAPPVEFLHATEGVLDTDSIWTPPMPERAGTDKIVEKLDALHVHANAFFRDTCSDHAFEVWNRSKA